MSELNCLWCNEKYQQQEDRRRIDERRENIEAHASLAKQIDNLSISFGKRLNWLTVSFVLLVIVLVGRDILRLEDLSNLKQLVMILAGAINARY